MRLPFPPAPRRVAAMAGVNLVNDLPPRDRDIASQAREQTRAEIAELQRRLGVTAVYVTYDQTEALTLGDARVEREPADGVEPTLVAGAGADGTTP